MGHNLDRNPESVGGVDSLFLPFLWLDRLEEVEIKGIHVHENFMINSYPASLFTVSLCSRVIITDL